MKKRLLSLLVVLTIAVSVLAVPAFASAESDMLSGSSEIVNWVDRTRMLVANETEAGLDYYVVSVASKKYQKVLGSELNVTEAVASPDGKKIAYTNDKGDVFVYDIAAAKAEKVSADDAIKYELQWSAAQDKLFFLQGDKSEVIAELTIATKKTVKVLDDKVNHKADLKVSANGKAFLYAVTKEGKVSGTDETDIAVDTANTEPQLFFLDTAVTGAKPQQLTTTKDNKVFAEFMGTTGYIYLSSDLENEEAVPVLKIIGKDAKETVIVPAGLYVAQLITLNGKVTIVAVNEEGSKDIYTLDMKTYALKKVGSLTDNVTKLSICPFINRMAAEISTDAGTAVAVVKQNGLESITK